MNGQYFDNIFQAICDGNTKREHTIKENQEPISLACLLERIEDKRRKESKMKKEAPELYDPAYVWG